MSNKIIFNFFDSDITLYALCKHFNLDPNDVLKFIFLNTNNDNIDLDFIKEYKINLVNKDVSNVYLTCKHVTTANDELASIKKYGLLNLKDALTYDTLLKKFLNNNNLFIDVINKTLTYKDKQIKLFEYAEDCSECVYGKCKYLKRNWDGTVDMITKNIWCEYRKALMPLCIKLFSHKAELEVHLCGNKKEVEEYSVVASYPEILLTIDKTIKDIFKEYANLCEAWQQLQNNKFYVLEFDSNISLFEYINTKNYYGDPYYYEDYLETCNLKLGVLEEALLPKCFFQIYS